MTRIPLSPRVAFAAFIAAIFVWVVLEALAGFGRSSRDGLWPLVVSRAALFPFVVGVPALGLSLLAMAGEVQLTRAAAARPAAPVAPGGITERVANLRTLTILAWIVGFYLGIWLLGFMLTAPLATLLYIRVAGKESWRAAVAGGAISWVFFNGIFQQCLQLPLEQRLGGLVTERFEEWLAFDFNQYLLFPFMDRIGC